MNSHSFNNSKNTNDLIILYNDESNRPNEIQSQNLSASQKINEEDILSFFK